MSRILPTFALLLVTLVALAASRAGAAPNDEYRPYAHPYPQIIQASDYSTIEAIEALARELEKLGDAEVSWETGGTSILFKHPRDPGLDIAVDVPEKGPVSVAKRSYPADNTIVLFRTLKKVLMDLSTTTKGYRARFDHFPTRAYEKRTIVEFDCGPKIVVLESFSNGPGDGERLYILDVVARTESYFWHR